MRDCTDRQCGNNPRRKVNPNDYDSVMEFLCDACEDYANAPKCPVCGDPVADHEEGRVCIDSEDVDAEEATMEAERESHRPLFGEPMEGCEEAD